MRVLALDTALGACSVAVVETSDDDAPRIASSLVMARGHAEALMPMVRDVVAEAGGFATLARIAVTVGPGSFTGLRVGLACARAIGLGTGLPVVGVTTFAALATPVLAARSGWGVAAAIDARHGRVFFQAFCADGGPLVPAALLSVEEAAATVGDALIVGSGADAVVAAAARPSVRKADGDHHAPDPIWLAQLGAACDPAGAPPRPVYLKAADATPQEGGRIARR